MGKIERKYLAHYIDASFGGETVNYVRLGKDLEEYSKELNPDIESTKNILGENSVKHSGYEPSSDVDPFYAYEGDPLFTQLDKIANEYLTGDDTKTTVVDVLLGSDGTVKWAYREDAIIGVNSVGGGTDGVQIPFTVHYDGNRTKGTWDMETNTFTPESNQTSGEGA